eukprot:365724-Chlamydomonas_euryale.AAC.5
MVYRSPFVEAVNRGQPCVRMVARQCDSVTLTRSQPGQWHSFPGLWLDVTAEKWRMFRKGPEKPVAVCVACASRRAHAEACRCRPCSNCRAHAGVGHAPVAAYMQRHAGVGRAPIAARYQACRCRPCASRRVHAEACGCRPCTGRHVHAGQCRCWPCALSQPLCLAPSIAPHSATRL